uniref:Uncharacterized protein n=1 Tax=Avena sativa TaxID=4498 RepID=A0ACD6A1A3_AVESA
MESSTTTTATPPAAGASKRQRKAALPLGDLTNLLPSTPAPRNPSARRAVPPAASDASACSSTTSATPVSKASSAAAVEELSLGKSPISTVYTSRKTQGRRSPTSVKAPFPTGAAASCPPPGKTKRASSHSTKKAPTAKDSHPISSSAPHPAKKKRHMTAENTSSGRPKFPVDFVEKQRAYFQEIDAFELPVEEASDAD